MKAVLLLAVVQLATCLTVHENIQKDKVSDEPAFRKFAYVTMWIDKPAAPAKVFQRVLSKAETVSLNSGTIMDNGLVDLSGGQKVRSALSLVQEGEAKGKEEGKPKQPMPLRPRNSQSTGITDMAKNLRDVGSKYPLVVITNSKDLQDPKVLEENPNLKLIWLNETDFLDRSCKIGIGHELHFQKLMIFKLTQFEKLIWVDTDLAFSGSADYVFNMDTKNGNRIYGQIDDYHCDGREWSPTSGGICTGMLLIQPTTLHFQGLMMHQKKMQMCWGDQSIVSTYFNGGHGKQAMQFERKTINFARCSKQGHMDVWHFSGSPDAPRIGDPEGFKRTSTGALVNMTQIKLKAKEKAEKAKAAKKKKA